MARWLRSALIVAEAVVAVNAVGGAAWLVLGGEGMDIRSTRLPAFGVERWWPAGVALLGTVAAPMAVSAVLAGRRAPAAPAAAIASGLTLVAWVVAQRPFGIPPSFLQPTLGAAGAGIALGGWALARGEA